jgi:hypothetical protein
MPIGSSFRSLVVLGVGEDQTMHVVTNKRIETDEEDQVAPPVVRQVAPPTSQVLREKVSPPVVHDQREP